MVTGWYALGKARKTKQNPWPWSSITRAPGRKAKCVLCPSLAFPASPSPTFLCILIDWGWKEPRLPWTFYRVEAGFELSPSFISQVLTSKHVLTQDMTWGCGFQHSPSVLERCVWNPPIPGALPWLFCVWYFSLNSLKFTLLRDTGHCCWLSEKTLGTDLSPPRPCLKAQPLLASWDRLFTHSVCLVWVTGDSVPWNMAYFSCSPCCSMTGEIYRQNFRQLYKGRPRKEADSIEHSIDFTIHRPTRRPDNVNISTVNDGLTNRKRNDF